VTLDEEYDSGDECAVGNPVVKSSREIEDERSDFARWKAKREMQIAAEGKFAPLAFGLPLDVMRTPEDLDEAGKLAFRIKRAKYVCPPVGVNWHLEQTEKVLEALRVFDVEHLKTINALEFLSCVMTSFGATGRGVFKGDALLEALQCWTVPQLREVTAYQFLGALVVGLGGNAEGIRAALGLQNADTTTILRKREWMEKYNEEAMRIQREVPADAEGKRGIMTVRGARMMMEWMACNARTPGEAFKYQRQIHLINGMITKNMRNLNVNVPVTPEDRDRVLGEAEENWGKTAGKKILDRVVREMVDQKRLNQEALARWTPPEAVLMTLDTPSDRTETPSSDTTMS
jgi:hypothetical protein